jgi:hypothetical protein
LKTYSCKVRLDGAVTNEVRKSGVTGPEIMILQHIHGADAVLEITPEIVKGKHQDKRDAEDGHVLTSAEERERLKYWYAVRDNPDPVVASKIAMIRSLFGPDHMELPETFAGMPVEQKAERVSQAQLAAATA